MDNWTKRNPTCPSCGTKEMVSMNLTKLTAKCMNKHMLMWDTFKESWYDPNSASA